MYIYVLKEVIDRHGSLNRSIFTRLLDASKAFDRVTHYILFQNMIDRGVSDILIDCLYNGIRMESYCV